MDFKDIERRTKPEKKIIWTIIEQGTAVSRAKKKKDYEYYICDFCKEKIIINKKWENTGGGILELRVNDFKKIKLALHNRCFIAARKEINKNYNISI